MMRVAGFLFFDDSSVDFNCVNGLGQCMCVKRTIHSCDSKIGNSGDNEIRRNVTTTTTMIFGDETECLSYRNHSYEPANSLSDDLGILGSGTSFDVQLGTGSQK